jgi:hypothetical protein
VGVTVGVGEAVGVGVIVGFGVVLGSGVGLVVHVGVGVAVGLGNRLGCTIRYNSTSAPRKRRMLIAIKAMRIRRDIVPPWGDRVIWIVLGRNIS